MVFVLLTFPAKPLIHLNFYLDLNESYVIRYIYEQASRIQIYVKAEFAFAYRLQPVLLFFLSPDSW